MQLFNENDGANIQAKIVLELVKDNSDVPYASYCRVYRWYNCREQGYVITCKLCHHQLNIAFFEHRNSGNICAVVWEQVTINPPTIETMQSDTVYRNKHDVSHSSRYQDYQDMVDYIHSTILAFWIEHNLP